MSYRRDKKKVGIGKVADWIKVQILLYLYRYYKEPSEEHFIEIKELLELHPIKFGRIVIAFNEKFSLHPPKGMAIIPPVKSTLKYGSSASYFRKIDEMAEDGLIRIYEEGMKYNRQYIFLSEKGFEVAELLEKIEKTMERADMEEQLVEIVCNHFRNIGYEVKREVRLESKFMDIVAKKEKTIAIEVKVSDWKRAFQQALTYRFGADFVYVAMPEQVIHRIDSEAFEEKGIGILSIGGESVRTVLEAKEQNFGKIGV